MTLLWNQVNHFNISERNKNRLFIGLFILMNLVAGGLVWAIAGQFIYPGVDGLFCFMGYPAVFIGFFGGMIYLFNQLK